MQEGRTPAAGCPQWLSSYFLGMSFLFGCLNNLEACFQDCIPVPGEFCGRLCSSTWGGLGRFMGKLGGTSVRGTGTPW